MINDREALAIVGDLPDRHESWRRQVLFCYGDELVPDAADRLRAAQPTLWSQPPGAFDQRLAELLETTAGARLKNPKHQAPESETPLDRTLRRLPLSSEARAVIARTKQLDWGHLPDGLRARLASEFVRRPEVASMLAVPPPPPAAEERVAAILRGNFSDLHVAAREKMAKAWSREFGNHPDEHAVVELIARRLSTPAAASYYDVSPLPPDDARINAKAKAMRDRSSAPARDQDGRFVTEKVYKASPF